MSVIQVLPTENNRHSQQIAQVLRQAGHKVHVGYITHTETQVIIITLCRCCPVDQTDNITKFIRVERAHIIFVRPDPDQSSSDFFAAGFLTHPEIDEQALTEAAKTFKEIRR